MIRETRCFKTYPNKSIIEDIVTRDGAPNEDSWSPFTGRKYIIEEQFCGSQAHRFKLQEFLTYFRNRDFKPSQVKTAKTAGMLQEVEKENAGFTTLEECVIDGVEHPRVLEYLIMLCAGFKKEEASPYRKARDYITLTKRNPNGEDDDAIEEKFLVTREDENSISNEEYESIINGLPHIIRSIWSYSKQYKANLFSFLFAYADMVDKRHGRTDIVITDFRNYRTININSDGTYRKDFIHAEDNKYDIYRNVLAIFRAPGSYPAEYNLCMKFLNYLNVLGIDYHDEDPAQFNNDFMRKMVCTYLPTNEDYMNEYKDVDPELLVALRPENIFATTKASLYVPATVEQGVYDYTQMVYFIDQALELAYKIWATTKSTTLFEVNKNLALEVLSDYIKAYTGNPDATIPLDSLYFHPANGILSMKGQDRTNRVQDYLTLDGSPFGTFKGSSEYKVVLTHYGFIIALDEDLDQIYYKSAEDCLKRLEDYNAKRSLSGEGDWHPLGVYSE